ncbi:antibiotic biosynthesis monooxygenase [Frankia sp. CNm7]|uniref:Antibiotic biosynthesis monooxygenase n=1 Tax=Frankia nepalensis TaxID=1836974 RepID=A0A937RLK4_9ACTN|nr:antibiotic biosynthesis monooxygenase family protein [Frankia nepalensis]MBL7495124.1 antibiotic biosynthesis monooxygenase [Frankia nepalensis]MBL7515430.1 antibiotic biosynthesis monooxygenase [Frankia nepalensis]MBL7523098.1 antibiotic biosynthesis monooxygenase [Frankia nepalensis]MBL7632362.1 antibiotic biosynthesis monooxygenase [Frankia nepalensis]
MSASGPVTGGTPVTEIAKFNVKPSTESDFIAAYHTVRHEIATSPGCRSIRMSRGVESPSSFLLIVEWDTLEAHTEGFRGSEGFLRWRAAIGPFFADTPTVEHVASVETSATLPLPPVDVTTGIA